MVTPRGQFIVPGPTEQAWVARAEPGHQEPAYESHLAMAVPLSAEEITALAHTAGWRARTALDPAQMIAYRRSMTVERWKRAFELA